MNCANHPDRERTAFCQNCGKPLCPECTRTVGTSIFCEPCITARTAGAAPGYSSIPGYPPPGPAGYPPAPGVSGVPNPGLAALLGFIPGVGAMYNEQYAKGIVHLIVFALLVSLSHENDIFGLFVMGWIVYQVIEAHHTARARRDGTPLPNPFGLNDLSERLGFGKSWPNSAPTSAPFTSTPFTPNPTAASAPPPDPSTPYSNVVPPASPYTPPYGYPYVPPVSHWGAPQDIPPYGAPPIPPIPPVPPMPLYPDPNSNVPYQRRFPAGAIWLIGLGVFFLLGNSGIFHLRARLFGPFLMIAIGVWIFVHRMTATGQGLENDGTAHYRWRLARAANGSFWIILTGIIWLLDSLHILSWGSSWPIYLIAIGVLLLFKRTMESGYAPGPYGPYPGYPNTPPPTPPVTTTAIVPTQDHPNSDQEGR